MGKSPASIYSPYRECPGHEETWILGKARLLCPLRLLYLQFINHHRSKKIWKRLLSESGKGPCSGCARYLCAIIAATVSAVTTARTKKSVKTHFLTTRTGAGFCRKGAANAFLRKWGGGLLMPKYPKNHKDVEYYVPGHRMA